MLADPHIRIDMALTDEHIYEVISSILPTGEGEISYERIAGLAKCHFNTVRNSTRRLESAGRLKMVGGKGRRAVIYKVVKDA